MVLYTPTDISVKIPIIRRTDSSGSTVYVRSADWDRHQHYLLIKVLPTCDRITVTSRGRQIFYVLPTAELERVSYQTTIPEQRWRHSKKPVGHVRGTEFRLYRRAILKHALGQKAPKDRRFVVTWYGWPDYTVTPVYAGRELTYRPLWSREQLLSLIKKRGKK